jgi:hypothetical protein
MDTTMLTYLITATAIAGVAIGVFIIPMIFPRGVQKLLHQIGAMGTRTALMVRPDGENGEIKIIDIEMGRLIDEVDHPQGLTSTDSTTFIKEVGGKPVLFEKATNRPIDESKILCKKEIYYWKYEGSVCECYWSGGKHIVVKW